MHIIARISPFLLLILCACSPKGSIQGTLFAPDGTPVTEANLNTHEKEIDVRRISNASPSFAFTKIPGGTYSIRVTSPQGWILMDPVELQPGEHLDIGEHTLNSFGTIAGTIPKQLLGRSLQVEAQQIEFDHYLSYAQSATVRVNENGTFSVPRLREGKYTLALQSALKQYNDETSKLGIEAVVTVKIGKETPVALKPSPGSVLVKGQVRYKGQALTNSQLQIVDPTIPHWEDSVLQNIQTDSEGRFLVWMHPEATPWVTAPIPDGRTIKIGDETANVVSKRVILADKWQIPTNGEEVLWEVPDERWTVNMVTTAGEPVILKNLDKPGGITWEAVDCDSHASSIRWFVGSRVELENCSPGIEYRLFATGQNATGAYWISARDQTFTYPEQGENPTVDLVLEPMSVEEE
ncbi:MAG: hypothetical protein ACI87O_001282 [Planctomycetota bacterium]|jgi:hypothetical protein